MTDTRSNKFLRSVGGANVPLTPAESWYAQKRLTDAQFDRDALNDAAKWWMRECEEAKAERDRLRAEKAELVKALELATDEIEELHRRSAQRDWAGYSGAHGVCVVYKARAVLAKCKESQP